MLDLVAMTRLNRVIIGGTYNDVFDPYTITYVFNTARNDSTNVEPTIVAEFDCEYTYWSFINDKDKNTKYRKVCNSFPVKIALKLE